MWFLMPYNFIVLCYRLVCAVSDAVRLIIYKHAHMGFLPLAVEAQTVVLAATLVETVVMVLAPIVRRKMLNLGVYQFINVVLISSTRLN